MAETCSQCDGWHIIVDRNNDWRTCPRCKGTGFDPEPTNSNFPACDDCRGNGTILDNQ
jgi:DnaJ-class molecular chaperone